MATLADSLVSSASRALRLRMRPDLSARRQRYHGQSYWVVKEPVGLNYFRFHEEEYAILCMLNGQISLQEIKDQFESEFTPQKITFQDLQQFIGMLHRSGLVVSEASGQGRQLKKRRDEKKRRELLGKFTNVFALRWRGVDPEWVLNKLYPFTAWFFSVTFMIINMALGIGALSLIAVQWDVFRSRLPAFHEFFGSWQNWLVMGIAMALAKVLHEFGHGLSCKHFKGECHEIGFMMLVFTPALYCNVSDSWMLPNKWHRAFIGAAGMYVEVFLASTATFIWWFTNPTTMINQVCLSLMFVCSVSTLMFNGNPLLRFDGYYILMDLIEIPNLRQKATEVLKRFVVSLCLGIEQPENPFLPQKNRFWFGVYTVLAVIYRWIVVFSIIMFLNQVLEPIGLKVIGQIVAFAGLFGLVVQPFYKMFKFFSTPGRMQKVKRHRIVATVCVAIAAVLFVVYVPLPFHVDCSFYIKPRDAESVYAAVPGKLIETLVRPGDYVEAQTVLARMDNLDLRLAVADLEGQLEQAESELEMLQRPRRYNSTAPNRMNEVRELRDAIRNQLDEKLADLSRLEIIAPINGTILPVDETPNRAPEGQLPTWSGAALNPVNLGAQLAASDRICQIGNPQEIVAEFVIDQTYIDLVKITDEVEMMLDAYPTMTFTSSIEKVSLPQLRESPVSLSSVAGGNVNSVTDPTTGRPRPISTSYSALAELPDSSGQLQIGLRGRAKIYTGWQPLGRRLYRFIAKTFHFEL